MKNDGSYDKISLILIFGHFRSKKDLFGIKGAERAGGGQANICGAYAENLFRASFGTHLQIFSKIADFFINFFGTHQIFSENANFFH